MSEQSSPAQYSIVSFYKFLVLNEERLSALREEFEQWGTKAGAVGLLIFAEEGVNGTLSGSAEAMEAFKALLVARLGTDRIQFKESVSEKRPFRRLSVQVREEAVTAGRAGIDEESFRALSPCAWQEILDSGEEVILLDTRNSYETDIGMFRGAIDPRIRNFKEFKKFIHESDLDRNKKVLMYCTGGIRCEKAIEDVIDAGFSEVHQLAGGILKYLEEFPNRNFEGECFVFDNRVAVTQELSPSARYTLCPHCGQPGEEKISCAHCSRGATICIRCKEIGKNTCSKNCNYQFEFQRERKKNAMQLE